MRFLATFILFLIGNLGFTQVQIVAEQDPDRNLTLIAFNKNPIPFTIRIEFLKLANLESWEGDIVFKVAKPGKSELVKLRSVYVNENTSFNYNTKLYKGNYQPSELDRPAYLIPVEEGTILSMRPLTAKMPVNTNNTESQSFVGVGFFFEKSAIICAPRKGIVSEIKMDGENAATGPSDFDLENFVEIYHQDGTFSRLTGLKANSAKVAVGETVLPGQAIGESSAQLNQTNHHVKMIQSRWEMGEMGMIWVNFPVNIFVGQLEVQTVGVITDFTSIHPAELISKEMDKKELRKFMGK